MKIIIASGFGQGRTKLSAFDAALKGSGIQNYNLVYLSSIIPVGTKIVKRSKYIARKSEYGHRLYIVRADIRSDRVGHYISAGLGWYQNDDGSGVFVEHEEEGETKEGVRLNIEHQILDSLRDLRSFRGLPFHESKVGMQISTGPVTGQASCAITVAIYKSEGWD